MAKEVVYIYNGTLFSIKKKEILPCAITLMELEGIIRREISQKNKKAKQKKHKFQNPVLRMFYFMS